MANYGNQLINMASGVKWISPMNAVFELVFTKNILFLIVYIIASLVILTLGLGFIAAVFDNVHNLIVSYHGGRIYKATRLENKGQFKALFSNEVKRLFSSKLYFMNSVVSSLMPIMILVILAFSVPQLKELQNPEVKQYAFAGGLFIIFMLGMTTTASSGINVEGANFWLIKTLPINYRLYALVKILLSVIMLGCGSLISSTIIIAVIRPNIIHSVYIVLFPLIYSILASVISLFINTKIYKLKWNNEAEAFKNSASVLLTMGIDIILSIILIVGGIILLYISPYISMLVTFVILVILTIIFTLVLFLTIDKSINKIEEF